MNYREQVINEELNKITNIIEKLREFYPTQELADTLEEAVGMINAAAFDSDFAENNGHGQESEDFEDFIKVVMDDFGSDSAIVKLEDRNWGVQGIHINNYGDIDGVADGIAYYRAKKKNWEDK